MKKTLHFTNGKESADIHVRVENGRLSICGTVYTGKKLWKNERNFISSGQCQETALELKLIPQKLFDVWERWHLNDMRPGTPQQEEVVREARRAGRVSYVDAVKLLESHGLLIDNGYRYGTAWLEEELPSEVVEYLESL